MLGDNHSSMFLKKLLVAKCFAWWRTVQCTLLRCHDHGQKIGFLIWISVATCNSYVCESTVCLKTHKLYFHFHPFKYLVITKKKLITYISIALALFFMAFFKAESDSFPGLAFVFKVLPWFFLNWCKK